jgi:two-component system, NarL family, response regulator NreC
MSVTVLLADDHPFIRRGLRNLLETEAGILVVGEAEDGLQVLELAEKRRPNILLVDLMMPNLNGLEVIRALHHRSPGTRAIVLSMQSAEPYITEAFRAGAWGYVLKDSAPAEVLYAIKQVMQDARFLSPKLPERLMFGISERTAAATPDDHERLTDRERQVLQMAAEGKTAAEIAKLLSISPRTVEVHRGRLMEKLGLRNQTELVRHAMQRGILPSDG